MFEVYRFRFISFIPIDLFHKLLHAPGSVHPFALKEQRSLNDIDGLK